MSEARIDKISNENSTAGPIISGITTFSGQNYFVPPKGTTAERPSYCSPGSIRFNTDSAKLEYFDSLQWLEMEAFNNELGGGTGSNTGLGNRGVFGGGYTNAPTSTTTNIIDYITISTVGNAQDFGDLTSGRQDATACSSSTRGLFASGADNRIDYVTISSTGNAQDFGDVITSNTVYASATGNSTRGIWAGGQPSGSNVIQYATIASTGNANDFGDLTTARYGLAACSSSVRGIFGGGHSGPTLYNVIDFVTISTTGNASDFGDLTDATVFSGSCSNSVRGLFAGGQTPSSPYTNVISYIAIATLGNSQDFGDLTFAKFSNAGVSSPTRGIFGGGRIESPAADTNIIDYVTIMSIGNAVDFGDLTSTVGRHKAGCSNGHGGL